MALSTILAIIFSLIALVIIIKKPEIGVYILVALTSYGLISSYIPVSPMKIIGGILLFAWFIAIIQRKKLGNIKSPVTTFIVIFFLINLISIIVAIDMQATLYVFQRLALLIVAYFLFVSFIQNHRQIKVVSWILILSGLVDTFFGYLDKINAALIKIPPDIAQNPGVPTLVRVKGFTGDPNFLALYLITLMPIAFYLASEEKIIWRKIIAAICFVTFGVFVVLTYSRGGFVGLVFTLFIIALKFRHQTKKLIAIGLVVTGIIVFAPKTYWERAGTLLALPYKQSRVVDASLEFRLNYLKLGEQMFFSNPISEVPFLSATRKDNLVA